MQQIQLHQPEGLAERQMEIEALLADAAVIGNQNRFRDLAREYAEIKPVVACFNEYRKMQDQISPAKEMQKDPDKSLRELATEELHHAQERTGLLELELQRLLLPQDPADNSNIFLEIRAGTGGAEAAVFAANLMRMYTRYAEQQGWKIEVLSPSQSDLSGYKEVIMRVIGTGAYSKLKFESGVHRVQRVPETEAQGRIHTSACTVAVMPE